MRIDQFVLKAAEKLKSCEFVEDPRLEAEYLLSFSLKKDRSYLYTYPECLLKESEIAAFEALLKRRLSGEPMAYLKGQKSFWTFDLEVTKDVLIPRPETELLVTGALKCLPENEKMRVADLGTGSGAIAIALALERPHWQIVATDQSSQALTVAEKNAKKLGCLSIKFYEGSWCQALPEKKYDAILSNPPYIAFDDQDVEKMVADFEPKKALFSGSSGLKDIEEIIVSSLSFLKQGGKLFFEHGLSQAEAVQQILKENHYQQIETFLDDAGRPRVTKGVFK